MSKACTAIFFIYGFCHCLATIIETKYKRMSETSDMGLIACGINAQSFNYCAIRVSDGICYPLTREWCELKNMTLGGAYLIKTTVEETLQTTLVGGYNRNPLPIILTDGSELEFRFMLHAGWTEYRIDLKDLSGNIVLHTTLRHPDDFYFDVLKNGSWTNSKGYINSVSFLVDSELFLRIACTTNAFMIYLDKADGILEWTYSYLLPPESITHISSYFYGTHGDLFKVTYKSGQK